MFLSCKKNLNFVKNALHNNFDVVCKSFIIENIEIGIVYLKTLTNENLISDLVLNPLLHLKNNTKKIEVEKLKKLVKNKKINKNKLKNLKKIKNKLKFNKFYIKNSKLSLTLQKIKNNILTTADCKIETTKNKILDEVLLGSVVVFAENCNGGICVDVKKIPARSPSEPPTSAVIYGPRIGFNESIETNLAMLRKRIPHKDFIAKTFSVGKYTKTKIIICHISSIANAKTVKAIYKKIKSIEIDGVVDSYYILSYLSGKSTIFKRAGISEKPDVVTSKILEGRVAILVDGSPIVLTVPFMIFEDIQNPNDYYSNSLYATFLRFVRLMGLFVAVVLPGMYLALRLYHFKVLPLRFLITITNATEGLPFTPFVEMLFILILFQILYEVSLRLPQYLGLATSIVGALILGQTGVSAGLISPPGVVIIAMSIISVYTVSDEIAQLTILRALFLIVGGCVGFLGIVGLSIYFINELANLNQFGTSYLAPYAPRKPKDLKDGLIKKPLYQMTTRPESIKNKNKTRQKSPGVKK